MRIFQFIGCLVITLVMPTISLGQSESIVETKHNLSVSGPGSIRATSEQEICIFCHTPHNAAPVQPLWNRRASLVAYVVYNSRSLDATPGQPTGDSKLCLSCHDGTIALGQVLSRGDVIRMADGMTTIPPGHRNIGTDLTDDHPISFEYSSSISQRDRRLADPMQLPEQIRLDPRGEMQCTSCHDAHDNSFGHFLVMNNEGSRLCTSCHQIQDTSIEAHADCSACHRQHSAPSGPFLLTGDRVTSTCLSCHDGSQLQAMNIRSDLQKISVHDTDEPMDPFMRMPGHTTCTDCHDPHTMSPGSTQGSDVHPNLGRIEGVSISGASMESSSFEYEVCFKCHADENVSRASWIPRVITQINTRLEFAPSAISSHPVAAPSRGEDVPSLRLGWTTGAEMHCSDCHGSDTSRKAGGTGPNGIHGSNEPPLLIARYETMDLTPESASAYALCYTCHYREGPDGILGDRSFPHRLHVVDNRTSCATCHDAHGVASVQGTTTGNSHLINFDSTVVFADQVTGRLEFRDLGTFAGSCTLTCHGYTHIDATYEQ